MGDLDDIRRKYAEGIRDVLKLRFSFCFHDANLSLRGR
jgi:hypothetical protein